MPVGDSLAVRVSVGEPTELVDAMLVGETVLLDVSVAVPMVALLLRPVGEMVCGELPVV